MFVLGIDPGLSRCGYGGIRSSGAHEQIVSAGVIRTDITRSVPDRLAHLRKELRELMLELEPDAVVVERVLFQTNARTAMSVGQASGVALLTAAELGCPVTEYSSNEVKLAVAGYGSATKAQVQEMVARLLGLAEAPKPADVADALALGLCHFSHVRLSHRPVISAGPSNGGQVL